jgi:hypothetical protein
VSFKFEMLICFNHAIIKCYLVIICSFSYLF